MRRIRRRRPRVRIRCLSLHLLAKTLILKSQGFELLLNFPLLFVQLILPLLLLLKQFFQALLLPERLQITAALNQARALQSSAGIRLFGVYRSGKNAKTE